MILGKNWKGRTGSTLLTILGFGQAALTIFAPELAEKLLTILPWLAGGTAGLGIYGVREAQGKR